MPKKGENIYKRKDGRWEGRYIKSRRADGKPRYGYVYGYKYKEVKDKLMPLKSYYLSQSTVQVTFWGTLRDWASCWMEETVSSKTKPSTYANYYSMLENHIFSAIGDKKLISITQVEVQEFVLSLQKKNLGANAIRNVFGMLNRVMKAAVRAGALLANPCFDIELPAKEHMTIEALTLQDQQRLEHAAMADKDGLPVMLALYTGMRIGEISALQWSDIDFEGGRLNVSQTVQRIANSEGCGGKTSLSFGEPKSLCGKRSIPLTAKLINLLSKEKEISSSEYVVGCHGLIAEPRTIRYRYERIVKKAGIRHLHFHGLRHTFSTRCIEQNMDIAALSRILGHSSIKMTLDTYVDATFEHRAASIKKLDNLFPQAI